MNHWEAGYVNHPPACTCTDCCKKRPGSQQPRERLVTKWRQKMEEEAQEKRKKAPRLLSKETYTCPGCLEEVLVYNEDERLFICQNPKCNHKYALAQLKEQNQEQEYGEG